jgi:hypothetical protein
MLASSGTAVGKARENEDPDTGLLCISPRGAAELFEGEMVLADMADELWAVDDEASAARRSILFAVVKALIVELEMMVCVAGAAEGGW